MAKIVFPRREIEKSIKLNEKTIEKINLFGTPVEEIREKELELEITPNRPDLFSLPIFLRSLNAFLGKNTDMYKLKTDKEAKLIVKPSVKKIRPYTAALIAKKVSLDENKIKELISLQEKLDSTLGRKRRKAAIGIFSLKDISFPVYYDAWSPDKIEFIPLGESKKMNALQILKRTKVGKEYHDILKEEKYFPILYDSNNQILSMPPIINSNSLGKIDTNTSSLFIECSGHDLEIQKKVINIFAATLAEMGSEVYQLEVKDSKSYYTPDLSLQTQEISLENANKLIGLNLSESEIPKLLKKMDIEYKDKKAHIPAWRTDILHEVDLIEEIAIAYGYDNLEPISSKTETTSGGQSQKSKIDKKIAQIVTGLGFLEISTLHFIKEDEAKRNHLKDFLKVDEAKTEYKVLRTDLTTPLFRIFSENIDVEYPQNLFEIGTVFEKNNQKITEKPHLSIGISPGNFTSVKATLDYLSRMAGLTFELKEEKKDVLIEGRCSQILLDKHLVGFMGEVNPKILSDWKMKMPLAIIEIDLDKIYSKLS